MAARDTGEYHAKIKAEIRITWGAFGNHKGPYQREIEVGR